MELQMRLLEAFSGSFQSTAHSRPWDVDVIMSGLHNEPTRNRSTDLSGQAPLGWLSNSKRVRRNSTWPQRDGKQKNTATKKRKASASRISCHAFFFFFPRQHSKLHIQKVPLAKHLSLKFEREALCISIKSSESCHLCGRLRHFCLNSTPRSLCWWLGRCLNYGYLRHHLSVLHFSTDLIIVIMRIT